MEFQNFDFSNNYIEFAIKWQKPIVVKRLQFLTKTYWTSCIFGEIPPGFSPFSRHVVVFYKLPKLSEKMSIWVYMHQNDRPNLYFQQLDDLDR